MFETVQGRRLSRLLAVLLGVALWWPILGPKLAQGQSADQAQAAFAQRGDSPTGEFDNDPAPGELREGEEVQDAEDGEGLERDIDHAQSIPPRLRLGAAGPVRLGVFAYQRERLADAHDVLARERGPPVI